MTFPISPHLLLAQLSAILATNLWLYIAYPAGRRKSAKINNE
ncbi:MAG: hypothetical protein V3R76_03835 [Gammaproteobacteria bacterium]